MELHLIGVESELTVALHPACTCEEVDPSSNIPAFHTKCPQRPADPWQTPLLGNHKFKKPNTAESSREAFPQHPRLRQAL